jgi:hypothetical protein
MYEFEEYSLTQKQFLSQLAQTDDQLHAKLYTAFLESVLPSYVEAAVSAPMQQLVQIKFCLLVLWVNTIASHTIDLALPARIEGLAELYLGNNQQQQPQQPLQPQQPPQPQQPLEPLIAIWLFFIYNFKDGCNMLFLRLLHSLITSRRTYN